ncbi:cysteine desulfurase family protein [Paenibacillus cymbidii]|uniref:cysteine desulfurase family protein n=1 Tax=Paenibacillus cymbidii TaxID=1639034 RepID=UPI0010819AF6|nr:cysteine desulfurase family protein [Paenibacillus cymbidii]
MIYLDYAATTPIDKEVAMAMWPYIEQHFGNPHGKYYSYALDAKKATDDARRQVAELIGCRDDEIVFTSGATEGNNFIIKGVADLRRTHGNHIITSRVEHSSVLETCRFLEQRGWKVTYLDVDKNGCIRLDDLIGQLTAETILVSLAWGNNELGSLQDIHEIGKALRSCSKGVLFHTDATQVVGKIPVNLKMLEVDLISFSAHKFYGPKGIGAAVLKRNKNGIYPRVTPLLHGGDQEMGLRGGTLAVHSIVGMGQAAFIARHTMMDQQKKMENLLLRFKTLFEVSGMEYRINGPQENRLPGIISVTVKGVNNELMIKSLADRLSISTGSACSSAKPSHVLEAIGLNRDEIRNTIRISFGKDTTENELIEAVQMIQDAYCTFKAIQ